MASVIDVEFVEVPPPRLEEVMAESERDYQKSMRAIAAVSVVPVLLTAGLWVAAVLYG